jgi:hypothetical protein
MEKETLEEAKIDSIFNEANVRFSETLDKLSDNSLKRETLEEAAERLWNDPSKQLTSKNSFIAGAKWQAERMYSEEDLREAFRQGQDNMDYSDTYGWDSKLTEQGWFEQFKKK